MTKKLPLALAGLGFLTLVAAAPASATTFSVGSKDVTVGSYTGHFTVDVIGATNLCGDCVVAQDGSKLGIIITRPGSNNGNLVDFTALSDLTLSIKAYVTQNGVAVPLLGGIYTVTGSGVMSGATPFGPHGETAGDIAPDYTPSVTIAFSPADLATPSVPYENGVDLMALDGHVTSFAEDLMVGVPEPGSASLVLMGLTGLLARRRPRAR